MSFYTSLAVLLFSAIALIVPSGFSLGAVMLVLGALCLLRRNAARFSLSGEDKALMLAFALYFLINTLLNVLHHAAGNEYDQHLRFVLAIPALLLLLAYPPRASAFWAGLALGGIGAIVLSLWQLRVGHIERPGGSTNPIQYGNIALVLATTCACGLAWARHQQRAMAWTLLLLLGTITGLAASFISGSRGSWMALPACVVLAVVLASRRHTGALVRNAAIVLIAALVVLWAVPQTGFKARIELAVSETSNYMHKNNAEVAETSVGARLEMWRVGVGMLSGHLLTGWGKKGLMDHKAQLVEQGLASPGVLDHSHLHNEYLDALVKRGIPGLLAVFILYGVPLVLFARHLRDGEGPRKYALAGILLVVSYMMFGLTQAFLTHNNGVMILAFLMAILWAKVRTTPAHPTTFA
ncbi:O-antigen ligase family protein [Herbaspirillum sp. LeCh32-8]|uniref:O-antigen ligase family protein n=1 Tax=Herbaspirillum sp. LeCh32-8 TaxID=2821356 RepID=UPI001AE8A654|nr:O-antigen ligase family protein [Herbaspirillum sp. LeCh32-8]MBP0597672.1 O-antigen ligase family protein [Herbaspirillum sp. LeCh32-8]